jgi:D-amino-acid dehydrogenase
MGGREIAVVGAGVVGMSAALYLQGDGHKVSVIDARAPGTLTSYGNAGGIVTGAVTPTSTPDLWREIPTMLFDRASPIRLRWRYLPRLAPWLLRFLLAGRRDQVDKSAAALAPILAQANDAHRELAALSGVHDVLRPVGWLKVYETERGSLEARSSES